MQYSKGKHCAYYHRYHLVWSTKYRYKVLLDDVRFRVRDIVRQVCHERDVEVIHGVLSSDHVHMFVSIPSKLAVSDLMRLMKGRSSHKVQREFLHLKNAVLGLPFLGQGIFFDHQRGHHAGHRTSVFRQPHCQSYRRQTVVV